MFCLTKHHGTQTHGGAQEQLNAFPVSSPDRDKQPALTPRAFRPARKQPPALFVTGKR